MCVYGLFRNPFAAARMLTNMPWLISSLANACCATTAGKGDHRHWGAEESGYDFTGTDALLNDFYADIARWNDENGIV